MAEQVKPGWWHSVQAEGTAHAADPSGAAGLPGVFITFEGGDGCGKSTHIRVLADALESQGREVLRLREPGGTAIGERLREVVLSPEHDEMAPEAELLIYEAARAQLVAQVILPALARGAVVLCDRFYDSTIAYQAYGRGLSREFVRQANVFACQGVRPNRTVLMRSASAAEGLERATHDVGADRMEAAGLDFHERVAEAFRLLETHSPDRIRVVDIAPAKSDTARAVFASVADLFGWDADALPFPPEFFEAVNDIHGVAAAQAAADAAARAARAGE